MRNSSGSSSLAGDREVSECRKIQPHEGARRLTSTVETTETRNTSADWLTPNYLSHAAEWKIKSLTQWLEKSGGHANNARIG